MKKFTFILFCFFTQFGFGQNWALFPYGQKSFYLQLSPHYANDSILRVWSQDSILTSVDTNHLFFNTQSHISETQNCYNELQNLDISGIGLFEESNGLIINGLDQQGSTIIYSDLTIPGNSFIFYNISIPGEFWFYLPNNEFSIFDTLTITLDSIGYGEVVNGIIDSIKYFSLHANQAIESLIPYDSVQICLSKNYGLISFIPFEQIYIGNQLIYSFKLIGFQKEGGIRYGNIFSDWKSFFPLHAGDVKKFNFEGVNTYSEITEGHGVIYDSIINVFEFPDYINLNLERRVFNTDLFLYDTIILSANLYEDEYEGILDGYGNVPIISHIGDSNSELDLFFNTETYVYMENGLTMFSREFSELDGVENFTDCASIESYEIYDDGSYVYNNIYGQSHFFYSDEVVFYYYTLVAARVGENTFGDLSLPPVFIDTMANDTTIITTALIFPNPVETEIYVNYNSKYLYSFSIYDMRGITIQAGEVIDQKIVVAGLKNGIYVLELNTAEGLLFEKFIKM